MESSVYYEADKTRIKCFFFFLLSFVTPRLSAQKGSGVTPVDSSAATTSSTTFTVASLFSSGIDYFGQTTEKALPI
ncbi:hypothetical protein LWM68_43840 [Niabella sp. W65]|nr:hypothetical protein [Niabella sp. W65]MCH7369057.1 hypothetical protein [Niabella sp. W65]